MVLPLIGGLVGAAGSIGSALLGADAQEDQLAYNWAINMYNQRKRDREVANAQAIAEKQQKEQKLGARDALGNTTRFVEGEGWVSKLSPEQQALYDYFMGSELPQRQRQFKESAERSFQEGDVADGLLDEFRRTRKELPSEIENLLFESQTRGQDEALAGVTETAMRQALRSGSSNAGSILAELAREGTKQRGDARVDSKLKALDYSDKKYSSDRGGLANLYNMFAQRATNPLGASLDVSQIPAGANSLMNVFSNQAQQGNSAVINASGMRGGTLNPVEANTGMANAVGAIGSSLGGFFENMGAQQGLGNQNALLRQYMSMGGQLSPEGIYGTVAQRNRANGGAF